MIFDLINFIFAFIVLLITGKIYRIPKIYLFILALHIGAIGLIHGFLISTNYMPDQFKYLEIAKNIRYFDFLSEKNFTSGLTVYFAGLFFGLFPIPYMESVYSIGIINFLIYLFLFTTLYKRNFFNSTFAVYFYLFYPSLLLYSSLALRDMLIFLTMFIAVYYITLQKKIYMVFIAFIVLSFVKFQNFMILTLAYIMIFITQKTINLRETFMLGLLISLLLLLFSDYLSISQLNHFRMAFYNENLDQILDPYIPVTSYWDIATLFLPHTIYFFFRPLPWNEPHFFQITQFIENIFILIIIIKILYIEKKYTLWKIKEFKLLNILLLLSLAIYGLVIYNSGTAVRYKFPFITIYILFSLHYIVRYNSTFKKEKAVNVPLNTFGYIDLWNLIRKNTVPIFFITFISTLTACCYVWLSEPTYKGSMLIEIGEVTFNSDTDNSKPMLIQPIEQPYDLIMAINQIIETNKLFDEVEIIPPQDKSLSIKINLQSSNEKMIQKQFNIINSTILQRHRLKTDYLKKINGIIRPTYISKSANIMIQNVQPYLYIFGIGVFGGLILSLLFVLVLNFIRFDFEHNKL